MGRGSVAKDPVTSPLLAGYFGHGNAGDEMILEMLQRRLGPAPFLSGPRPVGGQGIPRFHFFKLLHHLRRSRALLLGGGELFQSRTSVRSLAYYVSLPLLARLLVRPVLGFSLGLDPNLGPLGRWLTAFSLRKALSLWVRDETSQNFLKQAGIPSRLMPDVVWAWPVPKIPPPTSFQRVLWIPRFPALEDQGVSLRAALHSFPGNIKQGILALDPCEDAPALARFRNGLEIFHRLETWTTPNDLFEVLSRYDVVVTMRYHGLVAAALAGRPVVAVPGHGKVLDLARELNVPIVNPHAVLSTDWPDVLRRAFEAGAPTAGNRPTRAAAALEELAAILLFN